MLLLIKRIKNVFFDVINVCFYNSIPSAYRRSFQHFSGVLKSKNPSHSSLISKRCDTSLIIILRRSLTRSTARLGPSIYSAPAIKSSSMDQTFRGLSSRSVMFMCSPGYQSYSALNSKPSLTVLKTATSSFAPSSSTPTKARLRRICGT